MMWSISNATSGGGTDFACLSRYASAEQWWSCPARAVLVVPGSNAATAKATLGRTSQKAFDTLVAATGFEPVPPTPCRECHQMSVGEPTLADRRRPRAADSHLLSHLFA